MAALFALCLLGGQMAPTPFCSSQSLFSLRSQTCSLHCQTLSQPQMLDLPTRPAEEKKGTQRSASEVTVNGIKSLVEKPSEDNVAKCVRNHQNRRITDWM